MEKDPWLDLGNRMVIAAALAAIANFLLAAEVAPVGVVINNVVALSAAAFGVWIAFVGVFHVLPERSPKTLRGWSGIVFSALMCFAILWFMLGAVGGAYCKQSPTNAPWLCSRR